MCGIAGLFSISGGYVFVPSELDAMLAPMRHRGPDGDGHYIDHGIALGHLRLSIVDLQGGVQPMKAPGSAAVLSFNGEIYNAAKLRIELEAAGYVFKTSHSDTEVLLFSYLHWGDQCVKKFRGMFAFAIWDAVRETLFLGRDRLGIKPLYYTQVGDIFAFASELKGLLAVKGLSKKINPEAIEDYLTLGYVPDPKSIFEETHKLLPGHTLSISRHEGKAKIQQYWDLDFTKIDPAINAEEEILDRLADAVAVRLMADVPLGAFLSGGVDSTAVVGLMARSSETAVNTCSIGVDDVDYDETEYAEKVAQQFETNHRVRIADPATWLDLPQLARVYDEPFADNSAIPTLKVSAAARETVKVALSGDGGDEVFLGYRRQLMHLREASWRRKIPFLLRKYLFGFLGRYYPKLDFMPRIFRAKTTFEAMAMTDAEAYCHTVSKTPNNVMNKLRTGAFKQALDGYKTSQLFEQYYQKAPADCEENRIKYIDFKTYLAGGVLTKVDRASMKHSLEVRVPILDHEFVEWAARVPTQQQVKGGQGKYCFKKALEKIVDPEIINRPKKGFSVPVGKWMRDELSGLLDDLPTSKALMATGYLDGVTIKQLVNEHRSGKKNHEGVLWALIMLHESLDYLLDVE